MLIDSHCHLDRVNLTEHGDCLNNLIVDTLAAGVERMLCVCISQDNKDAVLSIAQQHDSIYASVGIHPSDVDNNIINVASLKNWADADKVVAMGETGLDYYYGKETKKLQKQSFANHLIAASELSLPIIVHTREAQQDTLDLIKEFGNERSAGVLHCFTESWEMAKAAMDMNYYISLSGIVTFKNANELREVAKKIPLDRLLIETDSPYLAPVPLRGKPNQPKYVKHVAEFVAGLKNVSYQELIDTTANNFFTLFNKAR